MRVLSFFALLICSVACFSQPKKYTTANAHSHNDYENAIPFYLAFQNGFGSIEADIFSVNDTLFVAHNKRDIKVDRTMRNLYLYPLQLALDSGSRHNLKLLIDIKDDFKITLPLLIKELDLLRKYLSNQNIKRSVTIVISGNRPPPSEFKNYPAYIFFDDDLRHKMTKQEWKRVALVSLPLTRIMRWNGKDSLTSENGRKWKHIIDSVHAAGKPIRFWAAPDTELSWWVQMDFGVDLIGTDKISELTEFIRRRASR